MQQPAKYFYNRLNSTNLYANEMLRKRHDQVPFWVRTDDQFAGRGQGHHSWVTEPGLNLTGTLVIFPNNVRASEQFMISKIFSLAAAGFLEMFIDEISLKWPNDLYAGDKKIGGILIETAIMGQFIDHAILGLGVNINQVNFPPDIPNPISISALTGLKYDLKEMEDLMIECFRNFYHLIESGNYDLVNSQYIKKLYRYNEYSGYRAGTETFTAKIVGVTEFGHLILQSQNGDLQTYAYQEVEYVLPS